MRFCIGSLVPSLCVPEGAKNRNKAKTISPRPLFSGRGLVRMESGCVQTLLEFTSCKLVQKESSKKDTICNRTKNRATFMSHTGKFLPGKVECILCCTAVERVNGSNRR